MSKDQPYRIFGVSHQVYLIALASIVLIVVALAAFIVWALLTGSTTFGSMGGPPGPVLVRATVDVQVRGVGDVALEL